MEIIFIVHLINRFGSTSVISTVQRLIIGECSLSYTSNLKTQFEKFANMRSHISSIKQCIWAFILSLALLTTTLWNNLLEDNINFIFDSS